MQITYKACTRTCQRTLKVFSLRLIHARPSDCSLQVFIPHHQMTHIFFHEFGKALDVYASQYKFVLAVDFNSEDHKNVFPDFLHNILSIKTVKNISNPSCIDLFLTNSQHSFQNTTVISNSLSDSHKLVVTILKILFSKPEPIELKYRNYKHFYVNLLAENLKSTLSKINNSYNYKNFESTFLQILDKHAPLKTLERTYS